MRPSASRSIVSWAAGTAVRAKPATSTVSPSSMTRGARPARSAASSRCAAGATSCACGIARSVSGSRWSVWACDAVTTSTKPSSAGSITRSVMRTCGLSVPAYLRVSESDRYGSSSRYRPSWPTRKPLCPSHQRCRPGPAPRTSARNASPARSGRIMRGIMPYVGIVFTGERLDRAAERRTDPAWVAAQAGSPRARAVLAGDAGIHLTTDDRLALLPLATLSASEPLLLGLDEAGPVFAVDADERPNGTIAAHGEGDP